MLIEQIIEFESRVPGPLVVHIFLKLVIFMTKHKSSKTNLRVHYLMLKMLQKAMYLDILDLGQVTKFNPKMQDFKRVLDLTWSKRKDFFQLAFKHQKFCFFIWLWKRVKCDPNRIKIVFFSKNLQKIAQQLGAPLPCPLCDMFELH